MTVGYDSLENFMRTNWALMQHHKYSLTDIENMIAWERQVYVAMTTMYLKEENERIKLEKQTAQQSRR
jgi:hypothetical protein